MQSATRCSRTQGLEGEKSSMFECLTATAAVVATHEARCGAALPWHATTVLAHCCCAIYVSIVTYIGGIHNTLGCISTLGAWFIYYKLLLCVVPKKTYLQVALLVAQIPVCHTTLCVSPPLWLGVKNCLNFVPQLLCIAAPCCASCAAATVVVRYPESLKFCSLSFVLKCALPRFVCCCHGCG